jgi:hypothetical protein
LLVEGIRLERQKEDVMAEKYEIIMDACLALSDEGREASQEIIARHYRFDSQAKPRSLPRDKSVVTERKVEASDFWNEDHSAMMRVFARDGFMNRFTGELLIFPAVLRLLSKELPSVMPYQMAWRIGEIHVAYYDLYACIDRLLPESRGGSVAESNLVTTTMPYILARSNATIEEMGWRLTREGFVDEWDGMSSWYVQYLNANQELRKLNYFNLWYIAAKKVLEL